MKKILNFVHRGMDGMATILIEEKNFAGHITHKFKRTFHEGLE